MRHSQEGEAEILLVRSAGSAQASSMVSQVSLDVPEPETLRTANTRAVTDFLKTLPIHDTVHAPWFCNACYCSNFCVRVPDRACIPE